MKTKILVFLLTLTWVLPARAQVNYAVSGSSAYVTSSPNASGDIVIASTYQGKPVTRIGDFAFSFCTNLTSVVIPNSVTSIGDFAFYVASLMSVTIPNSVTSIGNDAFRYCGNLTSVTIPNSVTSIGNLAFYSCTSLTNVTIPNSVIIIGDFAFSYCDSLTTVTIPNSVTYIGSFAFSYCLSLTSVTIPNSVTGIGDFAFSTCTSLTNISVDAANSVYSSLGGVLFNKAQSTLIQFPGGRGGSYSIPNSVTNIGNFAFGVCTSLTNVTIPNSVTSIGAQAFYYCTSLTTVTIPNSVTSIGITAFSYCYSLTNISVDAANSVYSSLGGVLFNKAQTTLIQFPGGRGGGYSIPNSVTNIGDSAFEGCTSLTDVTISNSVSKIGSSAFAGCTSLASVTIGTGVTTVGDSAFAGCSSLTSVTFLGNAPSQGEGMFDNVAPDAKVYYYDGTTGWEPTYGGYPTVMLGAPAPPSVAIQQTTTNTVVVSWPSTATGFVLQQNTNGLNSVNWSNVTTGVQTVGTNETLIVNPIGGSRFYRLVKP